MTYEQWCEENIGYKPITTYFMDFSIAEKFGKSAIKDTFKRAMAYAKTNYKYLTELCLVLNHKIWFLYESNSELATIYNDLWQKCDSYCMEHLKGAKLNYFLRTVD